MSRDLILSLFVGGSIRFGGFYNQTTADNVIGIFALLLSLLVLHKYKPFEKIKKWQTQRNSQQT